MVEFLEKHCAKIKTIPSLFRGRKCSFRGITRFTEESTTLFEPRNGRKWYKNISFTKNTAPANRIDSMFLFETCFGTYFREFAYICFHGTEFRAFFSSVEWFRAELREFSVPRNGSERNSESLLQVLFYGTHAQSNILINVGLSRKTKAFPHPCHMMI